MGVKSKIKNLICMTREKQLVPIQHNVDDAHVLAGKVAVILGGSGGIGLAIALSYAESGCKVVLCGTKESKLQKCMEQFPEGAAVTPMVFDITDIDALEANVQRAYEIYGSVDILVNSVGVHTENVDFMTMTPDEFDRVMNTNLRAPYFAIQQFAKVMTQDGRNQNRGGARHILLVSSSRGSEPAWSPYGISKWGINGMTKGLAQILLPYGIVVNAIAPGSTATELIGVKAGDAINSEENGLGRLAMPDEVANVARLLVSSAGDMIVGETVHVSGGRGTIDIR